MVCVAKVSLSEGSVTLPQLVFDRLEYILADHTSSYDDGLGAIAFRMLDEGAEIWSYDPNGRGRRFVKGKVPNTSLTITCRPQTLARLFDGGDFELGSDEPLLARGDFSAFDHLLDGIKPKETLVDLRASLKRRF